MDRELEYLATKTEFSYSYYCLSENTESKIPSYNLKGENLNLKSRICFADLLMFINPSYLYQINLEIKFYKYKDKVDSNITFLSREIIFEWFNYIEWFFDIKLDVIEDDSSYLVKVDYSNKKGQIILLLTMIRFVFEAPFQQAVYSAILYKKEHNELSLFYILNYILFIGAHGNNHPGHYWDCLGKYPIKMSDEEYKKIALESNETSGYGIAKSWLIDFRKYEGNKKPINDYFAKKELTIRKMYYSLDCLLDGSIYNKIKETLNSLIYETD